jgi:hypothetical protein
LIAWGQGKGWFRRKNFIAPGHQQPRWQSVGLSGVIWLKGQEWLSLWKDLTDMNEELSEVGDAIGSNFQPIRACRAPERAGEFDVQDRRLSSAGHAATV